MNLQRTQILSGPTGNINGTEIRPLLAGGSAYSLTNWLVKPYPVRGRLTQEQRSLKPKVRCVVERAFGMLKVRWRIALKKVGQIKGPLGCLVSLQYFCVICDFSVKTLNHKV